MRGRSAFLAMSGLPLALFVALVWEARRTEGWGGMAVAAAGLPPVLILSVVGAFVGGVYWRHAHQRGHADRGVIAATLLAALPAGWFVLRLLWLELT